jgi:hypothetical protein
VLGVTVGFISPMDVQLGKTKEKAMQRTGPTCFFGFDHVEEE